MKQIPTAFGRLRAISLAACACVCLAPLAAAARSSAPAAMPDARDGSHDFDFEIGEWSTHLQRLRHPLAGSTEWVEYDGRSTVRGVLKGRANIVELSVQGAAGRIEGASLRLYDPNARQWSLNFFNVAGGRLTAPMFGEFRDGRGEFVGQDTLGERSILVRFTIAKLAADSYRFEQSFSDDGGKTWEVNWIATDTRRAS